MSYMPSLDAQLSVRGRGLFSQIYAWMAAGLLVTGAVAAAVATSPTLSGLVFDNPLLYVALIALEIALVFVLSLAIGRLSPTLATALFVAYAALNGLTLAWIFLIYTRTSIATTFFVTAGTFGVMSLIGYTTGRDLTTLRNFLLMGLIGFLIGTIVNIFWASSALYGILTYTGIVIFVGLVAADTQRIKRMALQASDEASAGRLAILGALQLYLDFVNLFLLLLRVFGGRRD
jgi:FtsH-binding integral membrane protein